MDLTAVSLSINFNNYSDSGINEAETDSILESGIKIYSQPGLLTLINEGVGYNSTVVHTYCWGGTITITKNDNGPFSIKSIKLMRPYNTEQVQSAKLTVNYYTGTSEEIVVNIPYSTGNNGIVYQFSDARQKSLMKDVKIEFMESPNGEDNVRFGAIDDLVVNTKVLQ